MALLRRVGQLLWRAMRLRCPNCGGGPIFDSWLRMRAHCPRCGLPMERGDQGYQVGSYMFNIVAAELIFAVGFLGVLFLTWPDPPWDALLYGGMALMAVVPFLFFPFSKTLFLAFDLVFRPATSEELLATDSPARLSAPPADRARRPPPARRPQAPPAPAKPRDRAPDSPIPT